jgi:CO/xanthine dehydrogenase FAD-binding subunit
MGAMARLQQVLDFPGVQPGLQQAIRHTTNPQIRNASTVAGALVAADGRSPFAAAMLALDATIYFRSLSSGQIEVSLGEYYSLRREYQHGFLIIQLSTLINVDLVYEYVARTPADLPLVSTVLARWPSGRVRLVVGGFGSTPTLAMDGPDAGGVSSAAQNVCDRLEGDWIDTGHRISAEYCREVAGTLAKRCLGRMGS